jgi:hypothetical protein
LKRGAPLDKPSEMMAFSLSVIALGVLHLLIFCFEAASQNQACLSESNIQLFYRFEVYRQNLQFH